MTKIAIEIEIDDKVLAFLKIYADSIGIDYGSQIREILRDWVISVSEQITNEALRSVLSQDIPR